MSAIDDFNQIKDILVALNSLKPARFGYTEAVINATGSAEVTALTGTFIAEDSSQINSIPTPDLMNVDPLIVNIGLRTQTATLPRMAINHFFGRLSLNLLKLTEKVKLLTESHLVNRYITPSGDIMEDLTSVVATDHITLVKHKSPLSASAPITASAAITLGAAVYNGNAGLMTGADKKVLDDVSSEAVRTGGDQTITGTKTFNSRPAFNGGTSGSTSPFTVDSTEKVVGLNSELHEGLHTTDIVPIGTIIAWLPGYFTTNANGGYTPVSAPYSSNWKWCDGSLYNDPDSILFNGAGRYLPKLTDSRFLMGCSLLAAGEIGGNANNQVTLTSTELPAHTHTIAHTHSFADTSTTESAAHTHNTNYYSAQTFWDGVDNGSTDIVGGSVKGHTTSGNPSATHTHAVAGTTGASSAGSSGSSGTGSAFSILPKYLAVYYLIRVK